MISVLIASDIRLYREGLAEVLRRDGRVEVLGTAADLEETVRFQVRRAPDVILVDTGLPGATLMVRRLGESYPGSKTVALGVSERRADVLVYAEAGIAGYVCRESSVEDLVTAVERAVAGKLVCSPKIAAALLQRVATLANGDAPAAADVHLTPRERDVLRLIDRGLSNKEIASGLHIEVTTVKNHVHNILEKLGAPRRAAAAAIARRAGLLLPSRHTLANQS